MLHKDWGIRALRYGLIRDTLAVVHLILTLGFGTLPLSINADKYEPVERVSTLVDSQSLSTKVLTPVSLSG